MAASYKEFLASPNSALLAEAATLHYVTTTTSFSGATAIIKHLSALQRQVKKQKQEIMNVIDGNDSLAVEVDTALEFLTSGGTYLPGLDDNFLSDRVAYLSIMHIVKFDDNGKISQIRLQWDQGSLLKQLEMIGVSGRNWPIRDSREQLSMIQSCLRASGPAAPPSQDHNDVVIRTRGTSTNAMRDPHASLQLFGTREEIEAASSTAVVSPYAGHRPNQRSLADLLGNDSAPGNNGGRPASPSKRGQGSNHQRMRLFDGQDSQGDNNATKPSQYIRPNPNKYSHFQFSDGSEDVPQPSKAAEERPKSKHDSQWSFNDFNTPHKSQATKGAVRPQDTRNWNADEEPTEKAEKPVGKGRRDAETHFELKDDGERVVHHDQQGARARGSAHNDGSDLYKNKLFDQEDEVPGGRALGNITNLKDRGKDFDAHFTMTDDSPSHAQPQRQQNVPETRKKAVQMMDPTWSAYDQSPSQKENKPRAGNSQGEQGIHIAGDGMGGKKGTNRNWLYGGGDDEELPKPTGGRKGNQSAQKSVWGF